MARTRKTISIDEKIAQAKGNFEKAKARYDTAAKELEDLQAKQRSIQRNELIKAVEKSGKTYAEIMAFLESVDSGDI
ncbi:MAG: ErpK protein [Chloroflexi bacterium]|nr:ErpK protein [Chloroflexota bacterium]